MPATTLFESPPLSVIDYRCTAGPAAGVSPRGFRKAARGDRKIFQERLAAAV